MTFWDWLFRWIHFPLCGWLKIDVRYGAQTVLAVYTPKIGADICDLVSRVTKALSNCSKDLPSATAARDEAAYLIGEHCGFGSICWEIKHNARSKDHNLRNIHTMARFTYWRSLMYFSKSMLILHPANYYRNRTAIVDLKARTVNIGDLLVSDRRALHDAGYDHIDLETCPTLIDIIKQHSQLLKP